jgi:hypothetical protein
MRGSMKPNTWLDALVAFLRPNPHAFATVDGFTSYGDTSRSAGWFPAPDPYLTDDEQLMFYVALVSAAHF